MKVKIIEVDKEYIRFSNGSIMTSFHNPTCCEDNFADFEQLDDIARETEFDWPLTFEIIDEKGFRFGNRPMKMFFIPCYSYQNGYYSCDIEIELDGKTILELEAEEILI